jgi:hypothetical protein
MPVGILVSLKPTFSEELPADILEMAIFQQ